MKVILVVIVVVVIVVVVAVWKYAGGVEDSATALFCSARGGT